MGVKKFPVPCQKMFHYVFSHSPYVGGTNFYFFMFMTVGDGGVLTKLLDGKRGDIRVLKFFSVSF